MKRLGINIDHIATLRNARAENHPNILSAAKFAMKCGADLITIHLREDRRHIRDEDLKILSKIKSIPLNLEISASNKMIKIALKNKPKNVCIVPEKRNEITTEGGLNLKKNKKRLKYLIKKLNNSKIRTSLFINPSIQDIKVSKEIGVKCIEIHTGKISSLVKKNKNYKNEFFKIKNCAKFAKSLNLEVHAGHGLDYKTTKLLSKIEEIQEFNRNEYSILFGVDRFWSGVDFPGSTLSQGIIVKAPNPSINNPLIAHQKMWDPNFFHNTYPIYGKLKLRQGFGRLIRSMSDKGGVVILDSRYLYSQWLYSHLEDLPLEIFYNENQEKIMREVLRKAGLTKEFHERRIDPFLEVEQYEFIEDLGISGEKDNLLSKDSLEKIRRAS